MNEIIFTGPPLKMTTRDELIAEICGRGPAMVFHQDADDEDSGETNFLSRHSFADKEELARLLRMVADSLEGRERKITITSPAQFRV
jgi:hypothetical protein